MNDRQTLSVNSHYPKAAQPFLQAQDRSKFSSSKSVKPKDAKHSSKLSDIERKSDVSKPESRLSYSPEERVKLSS